MRASSEQEVRARRGDDTRQVSLARAVVGDGHVRPLSSAQEVIGDSIAAADWIRTEIPEDVHAPVHIGDARAAHPDLVGLALVAREVAVVDVVRLVAAVVEHQALALAGLASEATPQVRGVDADVLLDGFAFVGDVAAASGADRVVLSAVVGERTAESQTPVAGAPAMQTLRAVGVAFAPTTALSVESDAQTPGSRLAGVLDRLAGTGTDRIVHRRARPGDGGTRAYPAAAPVGASAELAAPAVPLGAAPQPLARVRGDIGPGARVNW